ncbi:MAG TPA: hypothetical protein VFU36_16390 [Jatrophihabitans sp.]|nr:hypothetical protein [Jatrophihabitans sp.]
MTSVVDQIRQRAHWDIAIRPEPFTKTRLNLTELTPSIEHATVRMRGWPLPFIARGDLLHGPTWVGQDIEPIRVPQMEAWRMFTSGQFTQLRVISAEMDRSTQGQEVIQVWEVLFYMTEVFELAARLALSKAGSPSTTIDVHLRGASGRTLIPGEPGRLLYDDYTATSDDIHYSVTLDRERLVAAPREEAVTATTNVFWQFGWEITDPRTLTEYQAQLVSGN